VIREDNVILLRKWQNAITDCERSSALRVPANPGETIHISTCTGVTVVGAKSPQTKPAKVDRSNIHQHLIK